MRRRTFLLLALVPLVPLQPSRLITFGDSLTSGYAAAHPYAPIVAQQINRRLVNLAESGTHIARQRAVIEAADLAQSDTALLLTGYNDMRGGTPIEDYTAELALALRSLGRAGRVYIGNCLRMTAAGYALDSGDKGSDERVALFNRAIAAACPAVVGVCAAYDPFNVSADLVHPSDAGHAQIARAFLAAMPRVVWLPIARRM